MAKIFINYRREDSAGYAGRLYDFLSEQLGERQIFMDIDAIQPGADFVQVIDSAVSACQMMVVLIGKDWLAMTNAEGRLRLEEPDDFVRLEISKALERDILVVPVLVGGAHMPAEVDLPAGLENLSRRNAIELENKNFRRDADVLIRLLNEATEQKHVTVTDHFSHFSAGARFKMIASILMAIAGLGLLVGAFAFTWATTPDLKLTVMDLWLADSGEYDIVLQTIAGDEPLPDPEVARLDDSLIAIPIGGLLLLLLSGIYFLRKGQQSGLLIAAALISLVMFLFPVIWEDFDKEHVRAISPDGLVYSTSEFIFFSIMALLVCLLKLGINLGMRVSIDDE